MREERTSPHHHDPTTEAALPPEPGASDPEETRANPPAAEPGKSNQPSTPTATETALPQGDEGPLLRRL